MASRAPASRRKHVVESAIVLALLLPGLLLFPLQMSQAMALFAYGVMSGFLVALLVSPRVALLVSAAFAVANMLAYLASPSTVLAALVMGASVLLYALTARRGISGYIVMAPTSVAFTLTQPPTMLPDSSAVADVLLVGLLAVIAGLWGAAAGAFIGRRVPKRRLGQMNARVTWIVAVTMAVVCAGVLAAVLALGQRQYGAWILLTLLIVMQPGLHKTWQKVRDRLLGTLAGFIVAIVIAIPLHGHPVALSLAAVVLFAIATYVQISGQRYWRFVMFLTPGVVLIVGSSSSVAVTDIARVVGTLIGAAIAVILLLILQWIGIRDVDDQQPAPSDAH